MENLERRHRKTLDYLSKTCPIIPKTNKKTKQEKCVRVCVGGRLFQPSGTFLPHAVPRHPPDAAGGGMAVVYSLWASWCQGWLKSLIHLGHAMEGVLSFHDCPLGSNEEERTDTAWLAVPLGEGNWRTESQSHAGVGRVCLYLLECERALSGWDVYKTSFRGSVCRVRHTNTHTHIFKSKPKNTAIHTHYIHTCLLQYHTLRHTRQGQTTYP